MYRFPCGVGGAMAAAVLSACGERAPGEPAHRVAVPVTLQAARNLTYPGVLGSPITLVDGKYAVHPTDSTPGERAFVELLDDMHVLHDINGDSVVDGAFLLASNEGGSGVFTWLVGVSGRDGAPKAIYTANLGDRVQVRSLTATDTSVVVEYVAGGPGDAACCPTLKVRQTFPMRGDTLVDVLTEELGRTTIADIEGDWRLERFDRDAEPLPDSVTITAQVAGDRVAGMAGCNRYSGPIRPAGVGREVKVGPTIATRMACPLLEYEIRYLRALDGVTQWGWSLGRLALTYQDEGGIGSLLFRQEL